MGKVSIRRSGIIAYLKENGCVERKDLWTHFGISENRLCEDLKALQVNGYQFDTTKLGYVSLVTQKNAKANVYEPITTPVIRKWFLLTWISICGEMHTDLYNNAYEHIGQKTVYNSLCKIYKMLDKIASSKPFTYTLNTFHRDVRELCMTGELSCDTHSLFEEKYVFRDVSCPRQVIISESTAEKMLFALNELDQKNPHVQSFRQKLLLFYPNSNFTNKHKDTCSQNPEIKNVYDRISTLVSYATISDFPYNIDFISKNTGLSIPQIRKDMQTLIKKSVRGFFTKNGFNTKLLTKDIPEMSVLSYLYSGKNQRILFLPYEEYILYKAIRNLAFILGDDFNIFNDEKVLLNYGGRDGWYMDVEDLWYSQE